MIEEEVRDIDGDREKSGRTHVNALDGHRRALDDDFARRESLLSEFALILFADKGRDVGLNAPRPKAGDH